MFADRIARDRLRGAGTRAPAQDRCDGGAITVWNKLAAQASVSPGATRLRPGADAPMSTLTEIGSDPSLRRYAGSLLRHAQDADDLVQDCLVRALDRLPDRSGDMPVRPWLFAILHNLFISRWRSARRWRKVVHDPGPHMPDGTVEPHRSGASPIAISSGASMPCRNSSARYCCSSAWSSWNTARPRRSSMSPLAPSCPGSAAPGTAARTHGRARATNPTAP